VTRANLEYEGSISIDTKLMEAADFLPYEQVGIYDVTNGARLSTYVIKGGPGEIGLNGAAARFVQPGDRIIIASYASYSEDEVGGHKPIKILLDEKNAIQTLMTDD